MKTIANSSVLIALSSIGQLTLLSQRFSEGILIPPAVWQEVVTSGMGRAGATEVRSASWLLVREVKESGLLTLLRTQLDYGEAEAIALAVQETANVILLDEKAARKKAVTLGLTVLGTVGVLIWAKHQGFIETLRPQLDQLQTRGHFRISQTVYQQALQRAGERF